MGQSYLLLGPEKGLKEDYIKELRSKIGSCEASKFYGFDDYEKELYPQLSTNDFFSDHKLVILDEAQEIKTADKIKALVAFIKNPSDCATLILASPEFYIAAELMNSVPKENRITFYEMFENKKPEWIRNYFRRNGFYIEQEACNSIIEMVNNNIQDFENTCSQMVVYYSTIEGKKNITYQDAEDFLAHTREEDANSLFGYIAKRKLESSLECLAALLRSKDSDRVPTMVTSRVESLFKRALSIHIVMRTQNEGLDKALGTALFPGEKPITRLKDKDSFRSAVSNYTEKEMEKIIILLSEYDIQIKDAGSLMQQTLLEKCIYEVICLKGKLFDKPAFASLQL